MENNNSNINPQLNYIMKGTQPFITNKIGQQQQQMNEQQFLFQKLYQNQTINTIENQLKSPNFHTSLPQNLTHLNSKMLYQNHNFLNNFALINNNLLQNTNNIVSHNLLSQGGNNMINHNSKISMENSLPRNNTKASIKEIGPNDQETHKKGTELFIGNLSLETVDEDLYELFNDCGEVAEVRVHKQAEAKKCYAFVRFKTREQMRNALNKNGMSLRARKLKITKSNENSTIFIGNIRKNWINEEVEIKVKRIFPNCEKIEHFPDLTKPKRNRGFCFVVFKNRNDAIRALNYVNSRNGINIDGIPLTCDWADVVDEDDANSKQVFVSGIKDNITEEKIREVFSQFGDISELILSRNHNNSKRKDLAFITFTTNTEAKAALEAFKTFNYLDVPVTVSLSFSHQVMQAKKKIKDTRKKISPNSQSSQFPNTSIVNNNLTSNLSNLVNNNPINQNALNSIINMLSMNKNVNPTMMAQMMTVAVSMILNQTSQTNTNKTNNYISTGDQNSVNNKLVGFQNINDNVSSKKGNYTERKTIKGKRKIRLRNKKCVNNRVNINSTTMGNNMNNNLNTDNKS